MKREVFERANYLRDVINRTGEFESLLLNAADTRAIQLREPDGELLNQTIMDEVLQKRLLACVKGYLGELEKEFEAL